MWLSENRGRGGDSPAKIMYAPEHRVERETEAEDMRELLLTRY